PNCARASPHTASPSQPRLRNVTFRAGHRAESAVSRWLYRRSRSKNVLPTKTTRSPSTSSNGFFVAWAPRRESRSRYFTAAATPKFGSRCIELARDYTSWTEIRKSKIEKRTAGPLFSGFRIQDSGFGIRDSGSAPDGRIGPLDRAAEVGEGKRLLQEGDVLQLAAGGQDFIREEARHEDDRRFLALGAELAEELDARLPRHQDVRDDEGVILVGDPEGGRFAVGDDVDDVAVVGERIPEQRSDLRLVVGHEASQGLPDGDHCFSIRFSGRTWRGRTNFSPRRCRVKSGHSSTLPAGGPPATMRRMVR